jgi:hypothetical protein
MLFEVSKYILLCLSKDSIKLVNFGSFWHNLNSNLCQIKGNMYIQKFNLYDINENTVSVDFGIR